MLYVRGIRSVRYVMLLLCVACLALAASSAKADELNDWMASLPLDGGPYGLDGDDDVRGLDPGSSMRLQMHDVADRGLGADTARTLSPCSMDRSVQRRLLCWSSHGRNLHMYLPKIAWNVIYVFRPRTLYSYKAVDVRFPPHLHVRLPFNATTNIGYEDEMLGARLRLKF